MDEKVTSNHKDFEIRSLNDITTTEIKYTLKRTNKSKSYGMDKVL